ncbi:MAG: hypothetical protein BGO70_10845 [Bacteroidetes bacterium 43-93]|nr:hypothetical protein [Bacteroidota bacterium]OJW95613.1 MAG: hypothetical protein BGO70_10845 [Bacteroidetes bacterium 43-93]
MNKYSGLKSILEKEICPNHGQSATVKTSDNILRGKISLEHVCCDKFEKHLTEIITDWVANEKASSIIDQLKF